MWNSEDRECIDYSLTRVQKQDTRTPRIPPLPPVSSAEVTDRTVRGPTSEAHSEPQQAASVRSPTDDRNHSNPSGGRTPPPRPPSSPTIGPCSELSPSRGSVPRQLLQMCLISLPIWQWIRNGVLLLLLFAAGCCCCCLSGPLRDLILVRQKALLLLLFLAFCSSATGAWRNEESVTDSGRRHEHITSPPNPAMFKMVCRAGPFRPLAAVEGDGCAGSTDKSCVHYQQVTHQDLLTSARILQNKGVLTWLRLSILTFTVFDCD